VGLGAGDYQMQIVAPPHATIDAGADATTGLTDVVSLTLNQSLTDDAIGMFFNYGSGSG
jgi:hypothetical protein